MDAVPFASGCGLVAAVAPHGREGHVGLIDMQSCPDGGLKWLLVYEDHDTKWNDVRALKSKKVSVPTPTAAAPSCLN
jgi:hypothetical protein